MLKTFAILLAASCAVLATPASAENSDARELCRTAYQWDKMDERISRFQASNDSAQLDYEAFVGRLEILMHDRKLSNDQMLFVRFACDAYISGLADAMKWTQKALEPALSKIPG